MAGKTEVRKPGERWLCYISLPSNTCLADTHDNGDPSLKHHRASVQDTGAPRPHKERPEAGQAQRWRLGVDRGVKQWYAVSPVARSKDTARPSDAGPARTPTRLIWCGAVSRLHVLPQYGVHVHAERHQQGQGKVSFQ
jgi:hypothetical protein